MPRAAPPAPSIETTVPSNAKVGTVLRTLLTKPPPSVLSASSLPSSYHSVLAAPAARAAGKLASATAKAASLWGIVTLQPT